MYELLKNRLENGHPFLKSVAIEEVIEKVKRFFAAASENVLLSSIMQAIEEKEDGDSL